MLAVDESILETEEVMVIVFVQFTIQLAKLVKSKMLNNILLPDPRQTPPSCFG